MKKNFMLIVALAAMLFLAAPITSEAAEAEGKWQLGNKGWWFELADGTYYADGMFEIDGEWYYFDEAGWMKTGWVLVSEDWFYFNNSGAMVTGWLQDGADWYYMDPEYGYMWTNSLVGDTYFVGEDGKMVTDHYFFAGENTIYAFDASGRRILGGWFQVVEYDFAQWAYIGTDGQLVEGWFKDGGSWYYLDEGLAKVGTYIMEYQGQNWLYEFATNGVMVKEVPVKKGWIKVDSSWYYYGDTGLVKGDWVNDGGTWYWMEHNGRMVTNRLVWDEQDSYYVIGSAGAMVRNQWVEVYGDWVYADASGKAIANNWLKLGNTWYYFEGCYMVENPIYIDGVLNLFNASGAWLGYSNVSNGWVAAYDSWYYLENGKFATGWRSIGGAWYYFNEYDNLAVADAIYNIDDKPYVFNASGAMVIGWYLDSWDDWCYADANGVAVDGWQQINGTWYYFDGHWMVEGGIYYVWEDEQYNFFADSGAWLGVVGEYADGWQYLHGNWYYFENGDFVEGLKKIGGQIYAFDPMMITNDYWYVGIYSTVGEQLGYGTYMVSLDANGHLVRNQWKYIKELEAWVWFDNQGFGALPESIYY